VLRPVLADVAAEIIEAVRGLPVYARPMEGEFGHGLRNGVELALNHLLAEIEAGGPVERPEIPLALGRGELRAGRSLDSLLGAYRVGARVAWRSFAQAGARAGLAPESMYLLAEAIFAYIDMLSGESAKGYAEAQSAAASEAVRVRRRLVRLLVRDPAPEPEVVHAAAAEARWPLPRTLAVLAIAGEGREAAAAHLPPEAIAETIGEVTCALLPDPDAPGRRAEVEQAIDAAGVRAGLGTTVPWPDSALSFARARGALALAPDGPGLTVAAERLGELLLAAEPGLAQELARQQLAALDRLPAGARQRLRQTLRTWLDEQGGLTRVAAALGVHPQTVRYRLGRLRELLGPALEDPEQRFWLALALRVTASG
jgi:PucR C-terminal helix-turn-helix domain